MTGQTQVGLCSARADIAQYLAQVLEKSERRSPRLVSSLVGWPRRCAFAMELRFY